MLLYYLSMLSTLRVGNDLPGLWWCPREGRITNLSPNMCFRMSTATMMKKILLTITRTYSLWNRQWDKGATVTLENAENFLKELNMQLAYDLVFLFLGIYLSEMKTHIYKKIFYKNIHTSFNHNSLKLETAKTFINKRMGKILWSIYTAGYIIAIKINRLVIHTM